MASDTAREMTLDEWVERLPEIHKARRELTTLRRQVEAVEAYAMNQPHPQDQLPHDRESVALVNMIKQHVIQLMKDASNDH